MKKKIIALVIVAVAVLTLPLPQKIKNTYYGIDTVSGTKADIKTDLVHLRFLVFKDKFFGHIFVSTPDGTVDYGKDCLKYAYKVPADSKKDEMYALTGWYYNDTKYQKDYGNGLVGTNENGFEGVMVYFSNTFDKVLICHSTKENGENNSNKRYIGNITENREKETLEFFSGFTDLS